MEQITVESRTRGLEKLSRWASLAWESLRHEEGQDKKKATKRTTFYSDEGWHLESQIERAPSSVTSWISNTQCPFHAPASNTSHPTLSPWEKNIIYHSFTCSFVFKLYFETVKKNKVQSSLKILGNLRQLLC